MDVKPVLADEVQLLSYGETRTTGAWVKFRLSDVKLLEIFRGLDLSLIHI
jgi:hypothetical protein